MFTTLTVINKRSRKRFLSEENVYKNYTFYTTRLFSKKSDNKKRINKFANRADIPIITDNCPLLEQYRLITLANTVLAHRSYRCIGVYDVSGSLPFLLPFLSEKGGAICVFTNNADAYTNACYEIYRDFGTPTLLTDKLSVILSAEIIFSQESIPIRPDCKLIIPDKNTDICIPDGLIFPEYCNPLLICAGLFYYGGFREFGRIKLKEGG